MPSHSVKGENKTNKDITWDDLIRHSEAQMAQMSSQMKRLRKSIVFFKKEKELGVPFPHPDMSRHKKAS